MLQRRRGAVARVVHPHGARQRVPFLRRLLRHGTQRDGSERERERKREREKERESERRGAGRAVSTQAGTANETLTLLKPC